jgi:hypothetical protein
MAHVFACIALVAYGATALTILLYRKQGARHRRRVSWLAWAFLVTLMGSAVDLTVHSHQVGIFEAIRAVLLALFVFGARGNVARLLRSE